jgi:Major Facilitator Superfamily/Cyclic nucleotide-binding domain
MKILREKLGDSLVAISSNFSNPQLRRLQLAGAGSITGQWAYAIATVVFAFNDGGAKAVGIVALIRTIPSAIAAPFTSTLADRFPRVAVMASASLGRVVTIGSAGAVALSGGPSWVVYVLVGTTSILATAFQPAEASLLPELARTPEELSAANVTRSSIDSIGSFVGPAIGGGLLAVTSTGAVFLVTAGTFLWSALLVSTIRPQGGLRRKVATEPAEREHFLREAGAGFKAIASDRRLRVVIGLYAAQTMLAGALGVLTVVTALDLLHRGNSGVGLLSSATGAGGLIGALIAFALIGRNRLAADFGIGIILWGAPLVAIGAWPHLPVALVALAFIGIGNTLVDVSGLTLLQRAAPPAVIARVFGVLQMLLVATIGLGAILEPVLIATIGIRWSLVATGAFLPVLAALTWRQLLRIDAESHAPPEVELLAKLPIFAPLPESTLERLAAQLETVSIPAGTVVIQQGDAGDTFYVVAEGELEVTVDDVPTATLGRGDAFGEIALLRDVPRTATVTAKTPARLLALEGEVFVEAVTASPPSASAADAMVGARLASARPVPGQSSA